MESGELVRLVLKLFQLQLHLSLTKNPNELFDGLFRLDSTLPCFLGHELIIQRGHLDSIFHAHSLKPFLQDGLLDQKLARPRSEVVYNLLLISLLELLKEVNVKQ